MEWNEIKFNNMHVHSHYSIADCVIVPKDLVELLHSRGHKYAALTEHGTLASSYELWNECKKRDMIPIIGNECYFVDDYEHEGAKINYNYGHIIVICMNEVGWKNLKRLHDISWERGYLRKPRIQLSDLCKYNEGLIITTGCMRGVMGLDYLKADKMWGGLNYYWRDLRVENRLRRLKRSFGDRMYAEIQLLELPSQIKLNKYIVKKAKKFNIPIIVSGDCHYLNKEDVRLHDAMICIGRGELLDDPDNSCYTTSQLWLKTAKQLNTARKRWYANTISASQLVKYIGNAQTLAERVELFPIRPKTNALPKFCDNQEQKLYDICLQHHRISELFDSEEYIERFQHEMNVIRTLGYFDYFLIVWDVIEWAISNNIPHNVRGSVCGSLVAYFMNITWVDPIRFNLPFERFLHEDRLSMPDIDMDFGTLGRERVIEYTENKYGKECVVHICSFLRWKPKAAIKDIGRILNIPFSELNGITSAISDKEKVDDWEDLKKFPAVVDYLSDKEELDEMSQRMLGLIRQQGVHASGIVITPGPCMDWLPVSYRVEKETNKTRKVTEWDMYALEDLGILKLDFLGVNQLDIMQKALTLINERHDVPFKRIGELYQHIDKFDDKKVYKLIAEGKTLGTFQLGTSDGMRKLGSDLKPDSVEEIFAMISLYRTALITDGLHNDYVKRKFGQNYNYEHPKMAQVLDGTYGIMLYQEQCVTGDSMIKTPYGDCTINNICKDKLIDAVYCVDEETGKICVRNILEYHSNGKKEVYELELDNGIRIRCTENHKILTERGWIQAQYLMEEDEIITLQTD